MTEPMFPIYQVGPDELLIFDDELTGPYCWVIYWYEIGDYEGDGVAIALRKDGKVDIGSLAHCSCYGPLSEWPYATEEIDTVLHEIDYDPDLPGDKKRSPNDYDYERWQAIGMKLRELLKEKKYGNPKGNPNRETETSEANPGE